MKKLSAVLTMLVLSATTLFAQWQPDVQLNDNPVQSHVAHNKNSIALSGNILHTVWFEKHDGDNYQIYYKKSTNKGLTWQPGKRITNTTKSTHDPVLAVSGNIINIFWIDNTGDLYQIRSLDAGVNWLAEKKINEDSYNSPSASVSGSVIHLVWSGKVGEVFYKRSGNAGSSWEATTLLSDKNSSSLPSIAVSDKEVHVVWQEKTDGAGSNSGIVYKRSVDAGKNWKADNSLVNHPSDFASIAVSGNEVYVIWRNKSDGNSIYIKNSPDGGINWRQDKRLTTDASATNFASIAASNQYLHLVSRGSKLNYKRSINGGVTWEAETAIPISATSAQEHSMVATGPTLHMVWDNDQNVFYKRLLHQSTKGLNPKGQNTSEQKTDEKNEEKADEDKKGDKINNDEKKGDDKKDMEKWVITPSGAKGVTGNVTIALPKDATWYLHFQTTDGKGLVRMDYAKSHSLIPGNYNVIVTSVPVLGVPVLKGMNTRLKAGTLHVVSTGESQWGIYDETRTKNYVTYTYSQKLGLPAGKYAISLNGQFLDVEIKDGEVTEF